MERGGQIEAFKSVTHFMDSPPKLLSTQFQATIYMKAICVTSESSPSNCYEEKNGSKSNKVRLLKTTLERQPYRQFSNL